jgi:hypothetical protein
MLTVRANMKRNTAMLTHRSTDEDITAMNLQDGRQAVSRLLARAPLTERSARRNGSLPSTRRCARSFRRANTSSATPPWRLGMSKPFLVHHLSSLCLRSPGSRRPHTSPGPTSQSTRPLGILLTVSIEAGAVRAIAHWDGLQSTTSSSTTVSISPAFNDAPTDSRVMQRARRHTRPVTTYSTRRWPCRRRPSSRQAALWSQGATSS